MDIKIGLLPYLKRGFIQTKNSKIHVFSNALLLAMVLFLIVGYFLAIEDRGRGIALLAISVTTLVILWDFFIRHIFNYAKERKAIVLEDEDRLLTQTTNLLFNIVKILELGLVDRAREHILELSKVLDEVLRSKNRKRLVRKLSTFLENLLRGLDSNVDLEIKTFTNKSDMTCGETIVINWTLKNGRNETHSFNFF